MNILLQTCAFVAELILTVALADFVSGAVHWIEDAYFDENTPVIGPTIIKPNIVHHHLPRYFTKLSWWQSSYELLFAGLAVLGAAAWLHLLTWQVVVFVALSVNANQIHKWSHRTRTENGRIISWLQDIRLLQTPRHHGLHHTDPKNTYYCPITNFVNPVLEKISFWNRLEKSIERLTGITHRDDTAVRGQGPGPAWLAEYRPEPRRTTAITAPLAKSHATCPRDCAHCAKSCRAHAKASGAHPNSKNHVFAA